MAEVIKSSTFDKWFSRLKDKQAVARIAARIDRLATGSLGDVKSLGGGLFEIRIDHGPGYRIYYTQRGHQIIILLRGGDKSTQSRDIAQATKLAENWKD